MRTRQRTWTVALLCGWLVGGAWSGNVWAQTSPDTLSHRGLHLGRWAGVSDMFMDGSTVLTQARGMWTRFTIEQDDLVFKHQQPSLSPAGYRYSTTGGEQAPGRIFAQPSSDQTQMAIIDFDDPAGLHETLLPLPLGASNAEHQRWTLGPARGNHVVVGYLSDGQYTLAILDASQSGQLTAVVQAPDTCKIYHHIGANDALGEDYLAVAAFDTLHLFSTDNLELLSSYVTDRPGSYYSGLAFHGDVLYALSNQPNRMDVFTVDAGTLVLQTRIYLGSRAYELAIEGDRMHAITIHDNVLVVWDISQPEEPLRVSPTGMEVQLHSQFRGDFLVSRNGYSGSSLTLFYMADLNNPVAVDSFDQRRWDGPSAVVGDRLFLTTGDSLFQSDISDPFSPGDFVAASRQGFYDLLGCYEAGGYLLLHEWLGDFHLRLTLHDPTTPGLDQLATLVDYEAVHGELTAIRSNQEWLVMVKDGKHVLADDLAHREIPRDTIYAIDLRPGQQLQQRTWVGADVYSPSVRENDLIFVEQLGDLASSRLVVWPLDEPSGEPVPVLDDIRYYPPVFFGDFLVVLEDDRVRPWYTPNPYDEIQIYDARDLLRPRPMVSSRGAELNPGGFGFIGSSLGISTRARQRDTLPGVVLVQESDRIDVFAEDGFPQIRNRWRAPVRPNVSSYGYTITGDAMYVTTDVGVDIYDISPLATATIPSSLDQALGEPAAQSWVAALYPNPTNAELTVMVHVAHPNELDLVVVNILGQEVMRVSPPVRPGVQTIPLDVSRLASGQYFLRFRSGPTDGSVVDQAGHPVDGWQSVPFTVVK